MFNHDPRGWEDFGTAAGGKEDLTTPAPDPQMLCRIPGQDRQQVPILHSDEETREQDSCFGLPNNGDCVSKLPQNTQP